MNPYLASASESVFFIGDARMVESTRKDNESIEAFWDSLALDLHILGVSGATEDLARYLFLHLLEDFPFDVLETVTSPAHRAGKSIAGFRFRRAFKRDFAACASKLAVCLGYDRAPSGLNNAEAAA